MRTIDGVRAAAVLTERNMLDGGDALPGFSYPLARLFTFEQ